MTPQHPCSFVDSLIPFVQSISTLIQHVSLKVVLCTFDKMNNFRSYLALGRTVFSANGHTAVSDLLFHTWCSPYPLEDLYSLYIGEIGLPLQNVGTHIEI